MDETPRRDELSELRRQATSEQPSEQDQRGTSNGTNAREAPRSGLTDREREERWPIG